MFDIAADIFRAVITGVIFLYLRSMRGKEHPRMRKAWVFFIIGFGLLFFGGLLNIADNFPQLSRYLTIGRRHARKHLAWALDCAATSAGASRDLLKSHRARVLTAEQPAQARRLLADAYDDFAWRAAA